MSHKVVIICLLIVFFDVDQSLLLQKFILDMEILAGCIVACELNNLVPQLTFIPMDNNEDAQIAQVNPYVICY